MTGSQLGAKDFELFEDDFDLPPQSWRPAAKLAWLDLPMVVRAECVLNELRRADLLQQNAELRKQLRKP